MRWRVISFAIGATAAAFCAVSAAGGGRLIVKSAELATIDSRLTMLPDGTVVHYASLLVSALNDVHQPGDTLVYDVARSNLVVRRAASPSHLLLVEPFSPVPIEAPLFAGVEVGKEVAIYDSSTEFFYASQAGYPYQAPSLDGPARLLYVGEIAVTYVGYQPAINPFQPDTDGDAVPDEADNCSVVANGPNDAPTAGPAQNDTDGDGFGNRCDGDFNNDCIVNPLDLGILRSVFFSVAPDADLNGDGIVNPIDLGLFRTLFFGAPGPSGVAACP